MDPQVFEAMRPYFLLKLEMLQAKTIYSVWEANSAVELAVSK